jgi:hypothetical protein
VDRETDVVQGDEVLPWRQGCLFAGGAVVEAAQPVGPWMEQRDAHRLSVVRIGVHASALMQVFRAEVAE